VNRIPLFGLKPYHAEKLQTLLLASSHLFQRYHFSPVLTPTLDYENNVSHVMNSSLQKACIKFFDSQSEVLILRPDHTIAVARLAASQLKASPLPLKLYYQGPVFRRFQHEDEIERYQTGVECIGLSDLKSEAEIISLAVESAMAMGITDLVIDIGHQELHHSWSQDQKEFLLNGRYDLLPSFPRRSGEDLLNNSPHLTKLYERLKSYPWISCVHINESLISPMAYYTGMMFEIYSPQLNCVLACGGRYDALLCQFGWDVPAIGFALNLNPLLVHKETLEKGIF